MNIETFISDAVRRSVEALYGELGDEQLQIQKTLSLIHISEPTRPY